MVIYRYEKKEWLFLNAGDVLSKLLLALNVALPLYHYPLSLRRTGPVHGLGPVTYGRRSQTYVLEEPQYSHSVLGGAYIGSGKILVAYFTYGLSVSSHHLV